MKEIIKQFIEIMKKERKHAQKIAHDIEVALDMRLQWDCRYDALNDLIEGDEFQALAALVKPEVEEQTLLELICKKHPAMYAQINHEVIWLAQVIDEYLEGNK